MITLSGTFVARRTCCSHEVCESCDQQGDRAFSAGTVRLKCSKLTAEHYFIPVMDDTIARGSRFGQRPAST
jgi:hypothetical protein